MFFCSLEEKWFDFGIGILKRRGTGPKDHIDTNLSKCNNVIERNV